MTRGPVAEFAAELRALRRSAGTPTYRTLARRANYSITVLSQAAAGIAVPAWPVVKAFVAACGGEPSEWEHRWQAMRRDQAIYDTAAAQAPPSEPPASDTFQAVRRAQDRQIVNVDPSDVQPIVGSFGPTIPTWAKLQLGVLKVFLLDDHELVRTGLRTLVESQPDMLVTGEASTAAEAKARIPVSKPDVAILDIRLPDEDGISVCRFVQTNVKSPPACMMLTSYADDEAMIAALSAGAAGFLTKDTRGEDILKAIRVLARGGSLLHPALRSSALERLRRRDQDLAALTTRERVIFELLGEGLNRSQIAERLHLAERTVDRLITQTMRKLRVPKRNELVALAARFLERRQNNAGARALAERLNTFYAD
ncbi:response regulator [Amycolatopsis sp. TNS106]|uniref:response regulator n=1 Tax=Amycolatopsis sp. TNS106 TaxID=2861750 RepID=UPI001C59FA07|nr:response regulator [Amycolatopsis sp. TNS106]